MAAKVSLPKLLPSSNWDFSKIPDKELRACLIWEYARESISFISARLALDLTARTQPSRYDFTLHKRVRCTRKERKDALENLKLMELESFDSESFHGRYWKCDYAYNEWYDFVRQHGGWGSRPWQDFEPKARDWAVQKLLERDITTPIENSLVGDLERLWQSASKELAEIRALPESQKYDDSEDCALFQSSVPVRYDDPDNAGERRLTAALTMDFKRYSDKEIVKAFAIWLKQNRPKEWPQKTKRGKKKNDLRVALEALGIMRVLHHVRFRDPRFPSMYKRLGESRCYKARKLAATHFRAWFPFLPEDELPASWNTGTGQFIMP